MTNEQIAAYVIETERRFRSRTPAKTVDEVLPVFRVGRSEMRRWVLCAYGVELSFDDLEPLDKALAPMFRRLRKEFPEDLW